MGGKYTTKKDWLGREKFYDEKGRLIGKVSNSFFGGRIIVDDKGRKVADIGHDFLGRQTLTITKPSFTGPKKTLLHNRYDMEDWEYCEICEDEDCMDDCDI